MNAREQAARAKMIEDSKAYWNEANGKEWYDYEHQAWVKHDRYVDCSHPDSMGCTCYGRIHRGQPVKL